MDFQTVLEVVYFVFMVLLLFGVTIFIHELGHFWVARRLGMRADVFSIGFGHAIWKRERGGVIYKVGWIPFGGYVALPQMEPGGGRTEDEDGNEIALPRVEPGKKIAVALAGAAGNVVLAILLAYVIFWAGKPSMLDETSSAIGFVREGSVAYEVGLRSGDRIAEVNGDPVSNWQDVAIAAALRNEVDLVVEQKITNLNPMPRLSRKTQSLILVWSMCTGLTRRSYSKYPTTSLIVRSSSSHVPLAYQRVLVTAGRS